MKLHKIHIKGFRNFDDAEIFFEKKTLIIGANDVGKTNLIYALRLLFDKTISEQDLELCDSDYNAYSGTGTIEITVTLCNVTEECLISTFAGSVKDGILMIRYTNQKNGNYKIFTGYDEKTFTELSTRQYIKRLNMQYVDTNRNLASFLRHEKSKLLQISKEKLTDEQTGSDNKKLVSIQEGLDSINQQISSLNYISTALEGVNHELCSLSVHNEDQSVCFVAGESNAEKLLDNLVLSCSNGESAIAIGGDGRNNQIFLATWIAKQNIQKSIDHVTFYAIEEPEAHLHPHQQRKLSEYIQESFKDQVIVTSHSPQIASQFDASSIVRLYTKNKYSYAACGGCSEMLKNVISKFGYRLNSLSAETFFSDGVFLVEGTSEVLFYNALAKSVGIDLDRYNISVLSIEGIGFKPYVAVCNALNIPWVLRTDNDIFSKPKQNPTHKYYAGISRVMGIIKEIDSNTEVFKYWEKHESDNEWPKDIEVSQRATELNNYIRENISKMGIFLSDVDLENDLANSNLQKKLIEHYGKRSINSLVEAMQKKKASNMLKFLENNHSELSILRNHNIINPLNSLIKTVVERTKPDVENANR